MTNTSGALQFKRQKPLLCSPLLAAILISTAFFIASAVIIDHKQFPADDFVIMLFHYDSIVDDWKDLEWSSRAIHLSAISQTKWYLSIIRKEGLHISQPALDPGKPEVGKQSLNELKELKRRWWKAIKEDECWVDPYPGMELFDGQRGSLPPWVFQKHNFSDYINDMKGNKEEKFQSLELILHA